MSTDAWCTEQLIADRLPNHMAFLTDAGDEAAQDAALQNIMESATQRARSLLRARYPLLIPSWDAGAYPPEVADAVADIAVWRIVSRRMNPTTGAGAGDASSTWYVNNKAASKFLEGVRDGKNHVTTATPQDTQRMRASLALPNVNSVF